MDEAFRERPAISHFRRSDRGSCPICCWVRLFFVGGRISLCGSEATARRGTGGRWYLCPDGWGCSAGTRALGGGSQTMRRRPVAASQLQPSVTVAGRLPSRAKCRQARDGHAAAHIDQGALRQQVQRDIERMQAVVTAPRAAQTDNLHRRRSFRRGYRARAVPSTRHHWRPRPDRQPVPGCVGRDVLAGACVPTSGPAGAAFEFALDRWRRGRLWHPRTASGAHGAGLGRSMRGTPVRASGAVPVGLCVPVITGILSRCRPAPHFDLRRRRGPLDLRFA